MTSAIEPPCGPARACVAFGLQAAVRGLRETAR